MCQIDPGGVHVRRRLLWGVVHVQQLLRPRVRLRRVRAGGGVRMARSRDDTSSLARGGTAILTEVGSNGSKITVQVIKEWQPMTVQIESVALG